jgi:large repetitive protein
MTSINITGIEDTTVIITCQATGTPQPTVQWQVKTANSQEFDNIASASNTTTYEFTCQMSDNGNQYRAIADNGITEPSTSDTATLTVITQQHSNECMHNEIQQMLPDGGRG